VGPPRVQEEVAPRQVELPGHGGRARCFPPGSHRRASFRADPDARPAARDCAVCSVPGAMLRPPAAVLPAGSLLPAWL